MTDFEKAKKIYARMAEHLVPVMKSGMEWVGLFLQGSQNYDLDYEGSDIDTKVIVLPSFTDFVLNRRPVSTTHIMENNEHLDFKDIRLMFDCIKKQNVNFVEILFTRYMILNPKYEDLFQSVLDAREDIATTTMPGSTVWSVWLWKSKRQWNIPILPPWTRSSALATIPSNSITPCVCGSL